MILFRKRKVKKLLEAYEAEYRREIPEDLLVKDELLAIKELNLEDIAAKYDALAGFEFFVTKADGMAPNPLYNVPAKSKCKPNVRIVHSAKAGIQKRLRLLRHHRFVNKQEFNEYPEFNVNIKLIDEDNNCWK